MIKSPFVVSQEDQSQRIKELIEKIRELILEDGFCDNYLVILARATPDPKEWDKEGQTVVYDSIYEISSTVIAKEIEQILEDLE